MNPTDWIIAGATVVIAIFTIKLTSATRGTLTQIQREFQATHRPRLRIRQVEYRDDGPNGEPCISFVVANVGDSDASIAEVRGADWDIPVGKDAPLVPRHVQWTVKDEYAGKILKSGESPTLTYQIGLALRARYCRRSAQNETMMFWCVIKYTDSLNTIRETSICRCLRIGDGMTAFRTLGYDAEGYEYED